MNFTMIPRFFRPSRWAALRLAGLAFAVAMLPTLPLADPAQEPPPIPQAAPAAQAPSAPAAVQPGVQAPASEPAQDDGVLEATLSSELVGKPLYLRGGYFGDELHFDQTGNLTSSSSRGSYTLSVIEINKVHVTRHRIDFEGLRYGLHFLGALPYEDPSTALDRVNITPKKKVVRISIDRQQVVKAVMPKPVIPKEPKEPKDVKVKKDAVPGSKKSDSAIGSLTYPQRAEVSEENQSSAPAPAATAPAPSSAGAVPAAPAAAPDARVAAPDAPAAASATTTASPASAALPDAPGAAPATGNAATPATAPDAPASAPATATTPDAAPAVPSAAPVATADAPVTAAAPAGTSAPTSNTEPSVEAVGDVATTTSSAHAAYQLKRALDNVFATGLDARMLAAMPDFWKLYYQAAADKTDYRPKDPAVFRQNTVDQKAKLVSTFEPESNDLAQSKGVAGLALYHVVIGADGQPGEIAVGRPIGFGLDENAVDSIRKAKFQPAIKDGQPVPVLLDLVVQFRIYSKITAVKGERATDEAEGPVLPGPYSIQKK